MARLFLLITAFMGGFTIMGLELSGFRFFSPVFGYSIYVSGSLIGIIMVALSFGYIVGGKLADKRRSKKLLFQIILAAGCYCFVMVATYRYILDFSFRTIAVRYGTLTGILFAAVVIYGPSMFLLSMISPYIIRLLAHEEDVGSVAGAVYGVSTIGSVFGTFLTSFVLIFTIGSHYTLIVLSAGILLTAIIGLIPHSRLYLLALVVLVLIPLSIPKFPDYVLLHKESLYNDILLIEGVDKLDASKKRYQLQVNWWTSYSTSVAEDRVLTQSYYDFFNLAPLLTPTDRILILGMGAGTSVIQYQRLFPEAAIDAVEIDPEIVKIAGDPRYFGVVPTEKVKIYAEDARPYLKRCTKKYDVVELDMFQGGPYVPFYVTTREFYQLLQSRLEEDAVVVMNILMLDNDKLLAASIVKTLKEVFPSVYVVEHHGNLIALVFNSPTNLKQIKDRLRTEKENYPAIAEVIDIAIDHLRIMSPYPGARVFTDRKADVEKITFVMVEKFVKKIPRR